MLQTLFLGTDIIHSFKSGGKCPPGGCSWFWKKMNGAQLLEFDSDKQNP